MNRKRRFWVLITTNNSETIGEKSMVSLHSSFQSARREMQDDMKAVLAMRGLSASDVEYEEEAMYAQTKDAQCCWCIGCKEV